MLLLYTTNRTQGRIATLNGMNDFDCNSCSYPSFALPNSEQPYSLPRPNYPPSPGPRPRPGPVYPPPDVPTPPDSPRYSSHITRTATTAYQGLPYESRSYLGVPIAEDNLAYGLDVSISRPNPPTPPPYPNPGPINPPPDVPTPPEYHNLPTSTRDELSY
jgi:hypothetical protein